MTNIKTVDITPDTSLLPKLGYAGYSPAQAIAELVDNSIDEILEDRELQVAIKIDGESIIVADNAKGMDEKEIILAMTLAHSEKMGKLGEFGLGLKTACLSLGEVFTIKTKHYSASKEYAITFDEAEWKCAGAGWTLQLQEHDSPGKNHYTIIRITRLKKFYPNLHNYIRTDLQKRFAPFIGEGKVKIIINGKLCRSEDPELIEGSKKTFSLHLQSGPTIYGWYGLLRQGSNKGLYGFTIFRRGRMITAYDKIAIGEHPTISRIIGEIHLDHVPVTTAKREFEKSSTDYREAEQALKDEFKEIIKQARQKASEEKVTKDVVEKLDIWKEKIAEAVNSDDFKNYTIKFKGLSPLRGPREGSEQEVEVEKRQSPSNESKPQAEPESTKTREPKEIHKKKRHIVRIKGKNVEFHHQFSQLGAEASWKNWKYLPGKMIEIFTNTDFPAFEATKDKAFYAVMIIAESISEVLVKEAEEDTANVNEVKELILRKASELEQELK
jgi:hypothetical protein